MEKQLINKIFNIKTEAEFKVLALETFHYQSNNIEVYKKYIESLNKDFSKITKLEEIPFLPIEFFKSHKVLAKNISHETIFESSGTTGQITSKHYVHSLEIYEKSFRLAFEQIYGNDFVLLALLPSYLERENSSLVFMVNDLIAKNKNPESGFYLKNYEELHQKLIQLENSNKKVILIGVTFALLDFVEKFPIKLRNTTIIETGGMKGRRKEITRTELHEILKQGFQTENIHSEYGMTELLSQAYLCNGQTNLNNSSLRGNRSNLKTNLFTFPNWAKILVRDLYDPFSYVAQNQSGGINVIDLANVYSCSFIETKDIGKLHANNQFEVLGRSDNSEIRGCNLMV